MRRETRVEKRIVRCQEITHRAVLAQDVLEKHRRLALHRVAQLRIPFFEQVGIRLDDVEVARFEPLTGEVLSKS